MARHTRVVFNATNTWYSISRGARHWDLRAELRLKEPAETPAVRLHALGLRIFGVASAGYFPADVGSQAWVEAFQGGDFF
jgi:hypothetical protein